jgi:hypothetical protein
VDKKKKPKRGNENPPYPIAEDIKMFKRCCVKCQETKHGENFLNWLDEVKDECISCTFYDTRSLIAYKRELTNDIKKYPYFC